MDRALLLLGVGVWGVAATPKVETLARSPEPLGPAAAAWALLYLAFLAAFLGARLGSARRAGLLTGLQSALAIALLPLGMPHFEGALLAVVGAQAWLVVRRFPAALGWILGQVLPLAFTIWDSHGPLGTAKASGEYVAFSLFATAVFALRERERRQRLELLEVQAELLGTRALVEATVAASEQARIRRELHDTLGHHLVVATSHLEQARRAKTPGLHLEQARSALDRLVVASRQVLAGLEPRLRLDRAVEALGGSIPGVRLEHRLDRLESPEPEVAWTVFRAVQEALTNAYRHGGTRTVRVEVEPAADADVVRIENDGDTPREIAPGVGLSSMRSRVEALGGRLDVDPGPPFSLRLFLPRARPGAAPSTELRA